MQRLGPYLKNSLLTRLELSYNHLGAKGAKILGGYLEGARIKEIILYKKNFGPEGMQYFCLKNKQLEYIDISQNHIGSVEAENLSLYLKGSSLTNINLSRNDSPLQRSNAIL